MATGAPDDELAELRRRKMAEIQEQARAQEEQAAERADIDAQKQLILRAILDPEARERLARVRIARPDVAESLENQLITLAQQGRIRGKIDDATMREFLSRVAPKSKDIKIERR